MKPGEAAPNDTARYVTYVLPTKAPFICDGSSWPHSGVGDSVGGCDLPRAVPPHDCRKRFAGTDAFDRRYGRNTARELADEPSGSSNPRYITNLLVQ